MVGNQQPSSLDTAPNDVVPVTALTLPRYSKVWSVRNRDLEIARLDFLSGLSNRAFARLDFLSDLRNWAKKFFAACGGATPFRKR